MGVARAPHPPTLFRVNGTFTASADLTLPPSGGTLTTLVLNRAREPSALSVLEFRGAENKSPRLKQGGSIVLAGLS